MAKLYENAKNAPIREKYIIEEGDHNTSWTVNIPDYFKNI